MGKTARDPGHPAHLSLNRLEHPLFSLKCGAGLLCQPFRYTDLPSFDAIPPTSRLEPHYEGVILNSMKAHVWVMPKRTVLDPQGQTIHHALSGLGYAQVKDVRQGKFFVLNLDGWNREEAQKQLERISKEVLTNPVIEEYRFEIVE